MAHRECSLILERSTWLGPFQALFGSVQVRTWKSKISVQFLPGTKSVDPDLPRQCPFPSVSLAHDVPCSTLGRTVNELEWALHNPLVWVIDSIMHSTKIGSLGCCAQDMIREYLGCWAQDMKGILHERKVRECLQCLAMFLRFIRA